MHLVGFLIRTLIMFNAKLHFALDLLITYLFDTIILRKILEVDNNELYRMKCGETEETFHLFMEGHRRTK